MGFGILFVGYILTMNIVVRNYTDALACGIMLVATKKLSPYDKYFRIANVMLWGMLVLGVGWLAFTVVSLTGAVSNETVGRVDNYLEFISGAYYMFYNYALFSGIKNIADRTEIPLLSFRARRQRNISAVFHMMYLVCVLTPIVPYPYSGLLVPVFAIVWIVLTGFNASVIYSCYMWIVLEGEEEIERRPSRFAIINKIADALNRFEDTIAAKRGEEENEKLRRKIEQNKSKINNKNKKK